MEKCIKQHPFICATRQKQVLIRLEWNRYSDWLGEHNWQVQTQEKMAHLENIKVKNQKSNAFNIGSPTIPAFKRTTVFLSMPC